MSHQTALLKRNSTDYFRAKIQMDLQRCLGKSEEKFSLQTKGPADAKRMMR